MLVWNKGSVHMVSHFTHCLKSTGLWTFVKYHVGLLSRLGYFTFCIMNGNSGELVFGGLVPAMFHNCRLMPFSKMIYWKVLGQYSLNNWWLKVLLKGATAVISQVLNQQTLDCRSSSLSFFLTSTLNLLMFPCPIMCDSIFLFYLNVTLFKCGCTVAFMKHCSVRKQKQQTFFKSTHCKFKPFVSTWNHFILHALH